MLDVVKSMFDKSMQREAKTITLFNDSTISFQCFFRKSKDGQKQIDTMVMYYPVSAPCSPGVLISYAGNTYVVLNQETAENDVYYKSAVVRTNGIITTNNGSVVGLPIYGSDVKNDNLQYGRIINMIDGNIDVVTEDCSLSRALRIDDLVNMWGRTWKITNLVYVDDGIAHITMEIVEDHEMELDYQISIGELPATVNVGDVGSIDVVASLNDNVVSGANLIYGSSDDSLATIDANGNISYLSEGEVYFIVTWTDQNITATSGFVNVVAVADVTPSIYVTPIEEIAFGFPETLTYYGMIGSERDDSMPIEFKIENFTGDSRLLKKITVTDNGNHTVDLEAEGSSLSGKRFDLVAYNAELGIENRQQVKIVSLF